MNFFGFSLLPKKEKSTRVYVSVGVCVFFIGICASPVLDLGKRGFYMPIWCPYFDPRLKVIFLFWSYGWGPLNFHLLTWPFNDFWFVSCLVSCLKCMILIGSVFWWWVSLHVISVWVHSADKNVDLLLY